jgi:hypothetical protein
MEHFAEVRRDKGHNSPRFASRAPICCFASPRALLVLLPERHEIHAIALRGQSV